MARKTHIRNASKGKSTVISTQKNADKSHNTLKKENFDRAKMLSDFAGMIIRLGFILAATAYLIKQMQVYPGYIGTVLTVTGFLFVILLFNLLWSVGLIVYYILIEWLSCNHEKPGRISQFFTWLFTILALLGIAVIGVIIALEIPAFR